MFKQLTNVLTRIASAMETANVLASAHNRLIADKNELSQHALAVQQQLLEHEQLRTVIHAEPNIGEITSKVEQDIGRKARSTRARVE